jgi:ADP-dependent NAD(P)H-hydrate dehydratase / NAD(P)H-hydrate epimerase
MKIVTSPEMREIDRATSERFGTPSLTLMENAGSAVAEFAAKSYPEAKSFGVICGKGNNGGDGFVVARKLHGRGKEVQVLLLADSRELHDDAAANYEKLPIKAVVAKSSSDLVSDQARAVFESPVLIDAILGSGFRPPVSGLYAEAIARINSSTAPVIAVDIPSGADADVMGDQTGAVARADVIVTFTAPRPAHVFGNLTSGPIVVAPIGSPDEAIQSALNLNVITAKEIALLLGPRPRDSNKGMYGHVLVVGGSVGKAGAAAMAGFSALRAGAGLVTVATPKSVLPTVAGFHPELMTEPLEETETGSISLSAMGSLHELAAHKTVGAVGPGITRHEETSNVVRVFLSSEKLPIVLDADGLNAYEKRPKELMGNGRTLVLTPHAGEMSRLTGLSTKEIQRDRVNVARSFAKEHGVILVLKGDRTIAASPNGDCWVNTTGNPGMATGGTGDILTGIVAGMLAQYPQRAFEAVLAAVHLHGLAGDIATAHVGEESLVATDLVQTLSDAFRRIREAAGQNWVTIGH